MPNLPILLLAAGNATRMGSPKQLLPWMGKTLFEQAVDTALTLKNHPLFVVVGAHQQQLLPLINPAITELVINSKWNNGMGTSIAVGIKTVLKRVPNALGVLILLVDQPLIDRDYLSSFFFRYRPNKKQIIASSYEDGRLGVPALFDAFYFKELLQLSKDRGAKKLIEKYKNQVVNISGGSLLTDVDTPEEYRDLLVKYVPNPQ